MELLAEELAEIKLMLRGDNAEENIMGLLWCHQLPLDFNTEWLELLEQIGQTYQALIPKIYTHPMAFNAYQKAMFQLIKMLLNHFDDGQIEGVLMPFFEQYAAEVALCNFEPNQRLWEVIAEQLDVQK